MTPVRHPSGLGRHLGLAVAVAVTALGATFLALDLADDTTSSVLPDAPLAAAIPPEHRPRIAEVFGVLEKAGPEAALGSLEEIAAAQPALGPAAHHVAHAIGRRAAELADHDPSTFHRCREGFHSGCYHGVVEAVVSRHGTGPAGAAEFCRRVIGPDADRTLALECAHGLGHGLTLRLEGNIFAALDRCGQISDGEPRRRCQEGVFMQNVVSAAHTHGTPGDGAGHRHQAASLHGSAGVRPDEPLYPCNRVEDSRLEACWAYQNVVFRLLNGDDWQATLEACERAPAPFVSVCHRGFGYQLGGLAAERPEEIVRACELARTEYVDACLAGAVRYFVDGSWHAEKAEHLCAALAARRRRHCYQTIGVRIGVLYPEPDDRTRECGSLHRRGAEICERASATVRTDS